MSKKLQIKCPKGPATHGFLSAPAKGRTYHSRVGYVCSLCKDSYDEDEWASKILWCENCNFDACPDCVRTKLYPKVAKEDSTIAAKPNQKRPANQVFDGITFATAGYLSLSKSDLQNLINRQGGELSDTVTWAVSYLICEDHHTAYTTVKVGEALKRQIPIVKLSFLLDSVDQGSLLDLCNSGIRTRYLLNKQAEKVNLPSSDSDSESSCSSCVTEQSDNSFELVSELRNKQGTGTKNQKPKALNILKNKKVEGKQQKAKNSPAKSLLKKEVKDVHSSGLSDKTLTEMVPKPFCGSNKKEQAGHVLEGIKFAISGSLPMSKADIQSLISEHGGEFSDTLTLSVKYLICEEQKIAFTTAKVRKALHQRIPIVKFSFLCKALQQGSLPDLSQANLRTQYLLNEQAEKVMLSCPPTASDWEVDPSSERSEDDRTEFRSKVENTKKGTEKKVGKQKVTTKQADEGSFVPKGKKPPTSVQSKKAKVEESSKKNDEKQTPAPNQGLKAHGCPGGHQLTAPAYILIGTPSFCGVCKHALTRSDRGLYCLPCRYDVCPSCTSKAGSIPMIAPAAKLSPNNVPSKSAPASSTMNAPKPFVPVVVHPVKKLSTPVLPKKQEFGAQKKGVFAGNAEGGDAFFFDFLTGLKLMDYKQYFMDQLGVESVADFQNIPPAHWEQIELHLKIARVVKLKNALKELGITIHEAESPCQVSPHLSRSRASQQQTLRYVEYRNQIRFAKEYQPPQPCRDHLLEHVQKALPSVTQMPLIVEECERILHSKMQHLPKGSPVLHPCQALALIAYTYDLQYQSTTEDGRDNLFEALNDTLRERSTNKMALLKPYLAYLMRGLELLPPVRSKVYRGIPGDATTIALVDSKYSEGKEIYWSAFTSTSTDLNKAKDFAGPGGIIFCIRIFSGRFVHLYSAFPNEYEVLMSPNICLIVTKAKYKGSDGYFYLDMLERESSAFVF